MAEPERDEVGPDQAGLDHAAAEAGDRGELVIRGRAVARIVERAVLDVPGVLRSSSRIGPITRRELPRAVVDMSTPHPNILIDVALTWPSPVARLCREIRDRIEESVTRMVGRRPSRVDIAVTELIAEEADRSAAEPEPAP
jgi:uncharacterized alkaline shock family protein YloU